MRYGDRAGQTSFEGAVVTTRFSEAADPMRSTEAPETTSYSIAGAQIVSPGAPAMTDSMHATSAPTIVFSEVLVLIGVVVM
jgi:hypothetical protein